MSMRKSFIGIVRSDQSAQQGYIDVYSPFFQAGLDYAMGHPDYTFPNTLKKISTRYGAEFNCYDENNRVSTDPGPYPGIVQNIDTLKNDGAYFIGYDLETSNSPDVENTNRTKYISLAATAAHSNGLALEIAPGIPGLPIQPATDLTPLLSNGDLFVIQAETAVPNGTTNTNISTFVNKVKPFAAEIHRINPNVRAIAEVSTTPGGGTTTLDMLQRCWMAVADECDGVTVWPGNQPDKLLSDFVSWFCS
jgi:hypothetical protein